MLKLEKISKKLDITLRQRDRIFTRPLLQAFAIALALHLSALILFPIALTRFSGSHQVHPPVSVAALLPTLSDVTTEIAEAEIPPRYLTAPKSRMPALPTPAPTSLQLAMPSLQPSKNELDFLNDFLDPQPHFAQPLTIRISGPLALCNRVTPKAQKPSTIPKNGRVVFLVQLENRSGKIFWIERKEAHADESINQLAEKLIQELLFEPVREAFVTEGEVEIIFST
ncbi:MAG: hypothetical protein LLG04_03060 [Parachlamydia sp.]|nr:hypothetical protein [Parachlamydia sp.]